MENAHIGQWLRRCYAVPDATEGDRATEAHLRLLAQRAEDALDRRDARRLDKRRC